MVSGTVQDVIVSERRFQYEADVKRDPLNYDSWFDYIRLEEAAGQPDRVLPQLQLPSAAPKRSSFKVMKMPAMEESI